MGRQRGEHAMKALVFAAGKGTRLRELTAARPKALVEVGGVALLEHVLRRLVAAGVTEAILNLHHCGEQIPPFLAARGNLGLKRVEFSREPELLDTGGGLKQAAWFFDDGKPFLVHNADVLSDIDLGALAAAHARTGALATLAAMPRTTERPLLFDEAHRLVGRRTASKGDVLVRAPQGALVPLGFGGIHAVSPALFPLLSETGAFPIFASYLRLAGEGAAINAHRTDGAKWRDCGRPEDLRPLE